MEKIFLSVLILTKNNERSIGYALHSIRCYADEIVILDSGSTDKTLDIASRYTDRIFYRDFDGHFGKQKNYGMSLCRGEWIFILDSDEFVGENFGYCLKYLHRKYRCLSLPRYHICDVVEWKHFYTKTHYYDWQNRFIRNDSRIFYGDNIVHENLQNYQPRLHCAAGHIFHLDFVLNDYNRRKEKVQYYDNLAGGGFPSMYLPEDCSYYTLAMHELPEPVIWAALRSDKNLIRHNLHDSFFIYLKERYKWDKSQLVTLARGWQNI